VHEKHRSPYPSPSRSLCRFSKCRKEKRLKAKRRSIWTRLGTVLGWSDPTFVHGSVAKVIRGIAPAHKEIPSGVLPARVDGYQTKRVKKVRITLCTFRTAISSPHARPTEFVLKDLQGPRQRKLPRKIGQIGRERPHFLAVNPPKSFVGSLPPSQTLPIDAFCAGESAAPRICQTTCLTFCRNKKGESRCPF
jgi:hypothetical protein